MSNQKAFQSALKSAAAFLQPISKPQNATSGNRASLVENLYQTLPQDGIAPNSREATDYRELSTQVINYGITLLSTLNRTATPRISPDALYVPRDQRTILGLTDLILLEGIYPNVTPGVLPPLDRRTKSSGYFSQIQNAVADGDRRDRSLLEAIVDALEPILASDSNEVSDAVRERLQMDIIACLGELAFSPGHEPATWQKRFFDRLDATPVPILLPLIVPLIQKTAPAWFQNQLTAYLSTVPLKRTGGVKDEIMFFIDTQNEVSIQTGALQQVSRLLSSIPSSSTIDQYFSAIAPQLLELLDDKGQLGAAAAILINNIFERRKRSVEKFFFPSLLQPLRPLNPQPPSPNDAEVGDIVTVTSEDEIELVLYRISSLFQSSAGSSYLASKILAPLVLPLWGVWQYSISTNVKNAIYNQMPRQLLTTSIKLQNGKSVLSEIIQEFDFDGEDHWRFSRGEMGGIKIVMRDDGLEPALVQLSVIEERVPRFIELALVANDDTFTEFFLWLCRVWLRGVSTTPPEHSPKQAFRLLFQLKVLEGILEHHSERFIHQPEQVIVLVKEILDDYVLVLKRERERLDSLQQPSIHSLGSIVGTEDSPGLEDEDPTGVEAVSIALQILNSIISTSFSRTVSEQEKKLLTTLQPSLNYLTESSIIASSLSSLTRALSLFISSQDLPLGTESIENPSPVSEEVLKQQKTLQTALLYLRDEMVPIRAHGLELLKSLVADRSPVVDVPAMTKLLVGMLQDKESFVYLGVVQTICELSDKHPGTVIGMLVEAYVDEKEIMGIDERLKVGEALMGTVQRLGEVAVGKVAGEIGDTMIGLAGRRKRRYKEADEIRHEKEEEDKNTKTTGEMDEEYAKILKEARIEAGIDNKATIEKEEGEDDAHWVSKVGEEDYRIRTSALSILGVLYETNASGPPSAIATSAIEVALGILNLERGKEQATVRRAAVHLIASILNGLEAKGTTELLRVVPKRRLEEIVRVLGYLRVTDDDGLVREQVGTLLEVLTE
ncbi:hypothetical protein DRE_02826 [Drechslerella stenobrocha 248]|uniref:RNA polymerase II assembly factor Rtp1 C-terminal domain-containing protein n=1 Tax=Drechslerella stenobrocha 248 TaxID=1043628 RepID=W7HWL5_9PEZI|nr:hypothetical protein DRE_02826 [Drechslerella stenobrocha 248]